MLTMISKLSRCWSGVAALFCLAACTDDAPDYFPGRAGLTWVYAVHAKNWRDESHHRLLATNLAPRQSGDRVLMRRLRHDGSIVFYALEEAGVFHMGTASGDSATHRFQGRGQPVLGFPLTVGTAWDRGGNTFLMPEFTCGYCTTTGPIVEASRLRYRIVDLAAIVRVPAGVFEDCIEVRGAGSVMADAGTAMNPVKISIAAREWYAPDVGLVKATWHEKPDNSLLGDGDLVMELQALLEE